MHNHSESRLDDTSYIIIKLQNREKLTQQECIINLPRLGNQKQELLSWLRASGIPGTRCGSETKINHFIYSTDTYQSNRDD